MGAMILSKEYGLILFHLESVWVDGEKFDAAKTRTKLAPGTEVKFFDKTYQGAEYKELSEDSVIHQAVAVWTGERPEHLLKKVQEEEYKKKLEEHRKSFMLYLRGEVFLRAALVRVKCEIAGYLSDTMGIAEHKDENDKKINIFFHTDDVKVFKKDIREYGKPAKQILPVGCLVSVDARRVHISGVKNVEYQAIAVLAGHWPLTPHPTLLPGGQGSTAPMYELPKGTFTFYYMELALEAKLQRKVNQLKDILGKSKGQIQYDWKAVQYIQSKEQFIDWKQSMGGSRRGPGLHRRQLQRGHGTHLKPGSMVVSVSRTRSRTRLVWTPRPRRPRGSRRRRQSNLPKCHLLYSFPPHYCSVGLSLFTSVVCWVQFGVFVHLNDVGPNIVESIIEFECLWL